MAHLDLEEQEQLDQFKYFWRKWGDLITWSLIVALLAYAGWNGFQYWRRSQAMQAAALYEQLEQATRAGDLARIERAFADIRDKAGASSYAQQAGLLAAKALFEKGRPDAAKSALGWVVEKADDTGLRAVARLRLAALLADEKAFDAALAQLGGNDLPASFAPLAADRRGDIYNLQGNKAQAIAEYRKALAGLDARLDYRRLIEVKLVALGADAQAEAAKAEART